MGLEAGDGIDARGSCFKASSGDHPRFATANQSPLYHVIAATQADSRDHLRNTPDAPLTGGMSESPCSIRRGMPSVFGPAGRRRNYFVFWRFILLTYGRGTDIVQVL